MSTKCKRDQFKICMKKQIYLIKKNLQLKNSKNVFFAFSNKISIVAASSVADSTLPESSSTVFSLFLINSFSFNLFVILSFSALTFFFDFNLKIVQAYQTFGLITMSTHKYTTIIQISIVSVITIYVITKNVCRWFPRSNKASWKMMI